MKHAMQKSGRLNQKNHHPMSHTVVATNHFRLLHLQNMQLGDLRRCTMHIVGTTPQNQCAMARYLVVGVARWESRLRRNICILVFAVQGGC